jgi:hypothetical protein
MRVALGFGLALGVYGGVGCDYIAIQSGFYTYLAFLHHRSGKSVGTREPSSQKIWGYTFFVEIFTSIF